MSTLTTAGITFGDATNQTTAATAAALVTTTNVLNATAGASTGAVGTYAFLGNNSNASVSAGSTYAGSGLRYAALQRSSGCAGRSIWSYTGGVSVGSVQPSVPAAPAGTWRAMGYGGGGSLGCCQNYAPATLFLRIS